MKSGRHSHSRSFSELLRRLIRSIAVVSSAFYFVSCAMPLGDPPPAAVLQKPPHSHLNGGQANVLIFAGASSWSAEIDSLAAILLAHGSSYQEVSSEELNQMTLDQIAQYSLLVVPGGDAPTLTNSLTPQTHAALREAVQHRGVSYLGFCAGAWAAISPAPAPGEDAAYGLSIVDGPIQQPNYLDQEGMKFAISRAQFPNKTQRDLLWYGGPITPDSPGGVIARYPDGTPAITQLWSQKGFVIVSGLHPAATPDILSALGLSDGEAVDPDFAWALLDAGIRQIPLPAF
jgi:glutamine amidotransferase-like uncharacterized protein